LTATIAGISGVTNLYFDETAVYNSTALSAARLLAHYNAGALRGYRGGTTSGLSHLRANDVLDSVSSDAPRNIRTGARSLVPTFQHGQAPLEELAKCQLAELPDGALFISRDGTIVLLDAAHRSVAPWNTVQMTFGDEFNVNQWPYADLRTDYSDSFIVNEVNASALGASLVTSSDATSIATYKKRSQSLGELPLAGGSDVPNITAALVAKYKDPMFRALSIDLDTADVHIADEVFLRDLGDRVRVIKTLPGGGWFDEELFIQKIEVNGSNDGTTWKVRLGVSPV